MFARLTTYWGKPHQKSGKKHEIIFLQYQYFNIIAGLDVSARQRCQKIKNEQTVVFDRVSRKVFTQHPL